MTFRQRLETKLTNEIGEGFAALGNLHVAREDEHDTIVRINALVLVQGLIEDVVEEMKQEELDPDE